MANDRQSPLAIGWRRFQARGGEVGALENVEIGQLRTLGEQA
jgi:hypothetical protein